MESKHLVFVYGTLRNNERNHHLMKEATCIAEQAWTNGIVFDTKFGYPVLKVNDEAMVYGEIYDVSGSQLKRLDELEGYVGEGENNYYDRIIQTIHTDKGDYAAYVYVMNNAQSEMDLTHVEKGDWKVFNLLKKQSYYYFAYGSCMDNERFKRDQVESHFTHIVGRGTLDGYSIRFNRRASDGGRANILEEGGTVEGKVYEITSDALTYLNRREGVNLGCYRPTVVQIKLDDQSFIEALTFIVIEKEAEIAPPAHYLEEILRGGEGLVSKTYLNSLIERVQVLVS